MDTLADSFDAPWSHLTDVELCQTVIHGGWLVVETDWSTCHVVPAGDAILHTVEPGDDCVCIPRIESTSGGFIATHSSLDGRELEESAND